MRKRGSWGLLALALTFLLAGAAVFCYPRVTAWQYARAVDGLHRSFAAATSGAQASDGQDEALQRLYEELCRRNEELYATRQEGLRDPFDYQQPAVSLADYGLADDVIGFLRIPALELELPIVLGANEENLKRGAAHLTQTSYPVGGENTNCVLAAHRGYYKAPMLRDVQLLQTGDEVYVENFRETLTYTVVETRIIEPTDIGELLIQDGRDLVTLVTCHPLGSNAQRYVVYCERAA